MRKSTMKCGRWRMRYSYIYVTPGTATAKNGASIVKYAATCNGVTYSNTLTAQGKDLAEIDRTVQNHETRITVLEQK